MEGCRQIQCNGTSHKVSKGLGGNDGGGMEMERQGQQQGCQDISKMWGKNIPAMHNNTSMQENVSRSHPYGSPFPGGGSCGPSQKQLTLKSSGLMVVVQLVQAARIQSWLCN